MNICFLNHIHELGGGEIWVLNTCRRLLDLGHRASIICPTRSPLHLAAERQNTDLYTYDFQEGSPFYRPLQSFLERRQADVLYCTVIGHYWEAKVLSDIVERINAGRDSNRLVLILKTGLPPLPTTTPEFYGAGVSSQVRRLHVVSQAVRRRFLEWNPGLHPDFVEVMHEGIDLARFEPSKHDRAEARSRWEIPDNHTAVTCLARLIPMKGQDNLLLAAAELAGKWPDTTFLLAGEGEDRERLEQLSAHLGLSGSVRFLGQVDEVASLLAATDIVCHPSLNDGMPNSLVEAMAMHKPVIASRTGGIEDLIEDGRTGILTPPHDVKALIDSLDRLIAEPSVAHDLAANSRSKVEEDFDAQRNVIRLVERLAEEQHLLDEQPLRPTAPYRPPPKPVPVLFLMQTLRTGGEETEIGILAKHLDRSKFRLLVASCEQTGEPAPVMRRLDELKIPVDTTCHHLPTLEDKLRHLIELIHNEGIRVVVACQDTWIAYCVFHNLGKYSCRLIEHGGIVNEVTRIPKDKTARYVGVSLAIAEAARTVMPDPSAARHIPSMVDLAEYQGLDRATARQALGFAPDHCAIVFLGRLDPKKGIERLIASAADILPSQPHARFLIAGPLDAFRPDWAEYLEQLAAPLSATGKLRFLGPLDRPADLLAAADLLVLPSIGEGMSHVIQEAGAAGIAVVAFDDGAAAEQLEHGEAGVLIDPAHPEQLTPVLESLIQDAAKRVDLSGRLRQKVARDYSAEALVPQWQDLLWEVAAEVPEPVRAPAVIAPDKVLPFPEEIQIQTNTACNATCIMCPYPETSKELPNGRMDEDLYRHILTECGNEPGLGRIEPFLMNEPFTDNRMVDFITLARQMAPHAWITLTSNGTLVTPKVTDRLIHSGLNAIWFSFNGATKETYEQIMGTKFETVVENIDYLLEVKPPSLQVFTNMIETVPMAPEIEDNIRGWQAKGVGSGSSVLVNRAGNVKNFVELNYRPVHQEPVRICDLLFHKMYILYNGDAVICCMDWRRTVIMGNVKEQSIRDIWTGEKYTYYRRMHEEGRAMELSLCNDCSWVRN